MEVGAGRLGTGLTEMVIKPAGSFGKVQTPRREGRVELKIYSLTCALNWRKLFTLAFSSQGYSKWKHQISSVTMVSRPFFLSAKSKRFIKMKTYVKSQ